MRFYILSLILGLISIHILNVQSLTLAVGEKCNQGDDYSPVPEDCSRYLRCAHGKFVGFQCGPGTLWDYIDKLCNYPHLVRCYKGEPVTPKPTPKPTQKPTPKPTQKPTTKPTPKPTPKTTTKSEPATPKPTPKPKTTTKIPVTFPPIGTCSQLDHLTSVTDDCTKYKECIDGELFIRNCPSGLNFDFLVEKCINPSDALCQPILQAGEVCNDKYSFSPVPSDCSKYLRCIDCGKFVEFTCPPNTLFDYQTKKCEDANKVQCHKEPAKTTVKPIITTTVKNLDPVAVCDENSEKQGMPEDCTKYKECSNGQYVIKTCVDELYFDFITETCMFDDEAQCTPYCKSSIDINSDLQGVCMNVDSCIGAAISGNCTEGLTCCVEDPTPPNSYNQNTLLTKDIFLQVTGDTIRNNVLYYYIIESMNIAKIQTEHQIAAYLSQLIGETNYFKNIESEKLENDFNGQIGNNKTGDGVLYRGRGGILLKGKSNYNKANSKIISLTNVYEKPFQVSFPSIAFKLAAWFWNENAFVIKSNKIAKKSSLSELADGTFLSFTQLTYSLTNNIKSLKERADVNDKILKKFTNIGLKRGRGMECKIDSEIGHAVPICLVDFKKPYCGCEGKFDVQSCPYGLTNDGTCRNSKIIKCCVESCYTDLDLVILVDSSGSIGQKNFEKEKLFVKELIKNFKISETGTRISLVQFDSQVKSLVNFANSTDMYTIYDAVNSMIFTGGDSNTASALKHANDFILRENNGMRDIELGVPKVVMIITDGKSNNPEKTKIMANELKRREINMISVGIGSVDLDELYVVSSTPNDQYYVSNFDKILDIISDITRTNCRQPAEIIENIDLSTSVNQETYKYFKYSLEPVTYEAFGEVYPENLSIELKEMSGSAEVSFSFHHPQPKVSSNYEEYDQTNDINENFYEDSVLRRNKVNHNNMNKIVPPKNLRSSSSKVFNLKNPNGTESVLYIGVKGLEVNNEIVMSVYNRTVTLEEISENSGKVSVHSFTRSVQLISLICSILLAKIL